MKSVLHCGGDIRCEVKGRRQYLRDFDQGDLEVLCSIIFKNHDKKELDKVK